MKLSKNTEYKLELAIGGKVDNSLAKSVSNVNGKLDSVGSTIKTVAAVGGRADHSLTKSVSNINGKLGSISSTVKKVAAVTVATLASIKLVDFVKECDEASKVMETSMAGVAKVVDGLKDENGKVTKSYYEMKNSIIDLSKELPMTAEGIATIMEAAGQSNIAKNELLEFSETATKMGIAFDTTADKSGEWMAAWRTALDLDQNEVTTLADQINYLGNTSSENAIKLSEVVTTVGSLAKTAGVSGEEVAAMAASMTKVQSNVASTGIKNFLLALSMGESATLRQDGAYEKLGLKAKNVAKAMQVDSEGTILDVLERISKLDKDVQTSTMKDLFGRESLSSIAPMIANLDNLKEQFNKVGDASLYAGSMEKEYLAASSTNANIDVLRDNKIQAMKIQIGDSIVPLSALVSQTIGNIAESFGDFVEDSAPAINRAVDGIKDTFNEFAPTAVNTLKSLGDSGAELFDKIKPIGSWILDNQQVIPEFIISTGSAMVTYKIAKNVSDIASEVKNIGGPLKYLSTIITNPWALAITGVAAGIALIATNVALTNKKLKEEDLAQRFGDISLSLKDLNSISNDLIKDDNFNKISESLDIRESMEELEDTIGDSISSLSKMNWKVGIGLDLSDEEQAQYKHNITSLISDTQELLENDQYSLNLALDVLTDNDAEGKAIKESFNEFYLENQQELANLGKKLNKTVNDAFADGILSIDETKSIEKLQKQIASITKKAAESKFDAETEVLNAKVTGKALTSESYENLLSQVNDSASEMKSAYDSSLETAIAGERNLLNSGKITKDEYASRVAEHTRNYNDQVGNVELKVANFGLNTINDTYTDEINENIPTMTEIMENAITESIAVLKENPDNASWNLSSIVSEITNSINLSKSEKSNIKDMLKDLEPQKVELQKLADSYIEAGKTPPESISKGLTDIATLEAMTGDTDAIYQLLGTTIAGSTEYAQLLDLAEKSGESIPPELAKGINLKLPELKSTGSKVITSVASGMNEEIDKGTIANAMARLKKSLNLNPGKSPAVSSLLSDIDNINQNSKLPGYATGGIITSPTIATFAEDGPEAAIPLDGSQNAIQLWQMAGRILGVFDNDDPRSVTASYAIADGYNQLVNNTSTTNKVTNNTNEAPFIININYNIASGADVEAVKQGSQSIQQEVFRAIEAYEKSKRRTRMG